MVCSDNVCNRQRSKPEDIPVVAPPTPAPSYREFAPPGYDTVMKKYKNRIYIVPLENSNEPGIFSPMTPPPPAISPLSSTTATPVQARASVHLHTVPELVELQVVVDHHHGRNATSNVQDTTRSDESECVIEQEDSHNDDVPVVIIEGSATGKNTNEDSRSQSV